jgi:hypothetical protein
MDPKRAEQACLSIKKSKFALSENALRKTHLFIGHYIKNDNPMEIIPIAQQ